MRYLGARDVMAAVGLLAAGIAAGDEDVVRILLTSDHSIVNAHDRDRNVPLHVAASHSNPRVRALMFDCN